MLLLFSTGVANFLKKICLFSRFTSLSVHDQGEPYSHKQLGEGLLRQAEICPRHTLMKGKKTETEEEVGGQYQRVGRNRLCQLN